MRLAPNRTLARFALACALATAGCRSIPATSDDDGGMASTDMARPVLGAPITADKGTWTWVDFPDSVCDDGSPTGIGVRLTDSNNLVVFLNGGGACWDYTTCVTLNTSTHGPYGKAQFQQIANLNTTGTVLGNGATDPYAGWNMVYVPYCTGDVHAGDNVITYTRGGTDPHVIHHKGHPNFVAFMKRVAATVTNPDKLVIAGSSAGGFGAAINYDTARQYFPLAKSYLLDDSGPPFVGDDVASALRADWYASWNLSATFGTLCPGCSDDLSAFIPILVAKYPSDRMALLETEEDKTISGFYLVSGAGFAQDLVCDLAPERLDPTKTFKYFFESGSTHTMLGDIASHTANGVALSDWLKQFDSDDPAWKSTLDPVTCTQ